MTDSGGLQEEAPHSGKPVLVMRMETERPEAVEAGTVKIVGVKEEETFHIVQTLSDDARHTFRWLEQLIHMVMDMPVKEL